MVGIAGGAQADAVFVILPFGGKPWTTLGPCFWERSGCAPAVPWRALAHRRVCSVRTIWVGVEEQRKHSAVEMIQCPSLQLTPWLFL